MDKEKCPKIDSCLILKDNMFLNDRSKMTFKRIYCEAGEEKYCSCKRFLAGMITDEAVPENILPNSTLPVEKILMISRSSLN